MEFNREKWHLYLYNKVSSVSSEHMDDHAKYLLDCIWELRNKLKQKELYELTLKSQYLLSKIESLKSEISEIEFEDTNVHKMVMDCFFASIFESMENIKSTANEIIKEIEKTKESFR